MSRVLGARLYKLKKHASISSSVTWELTVHAKRLARLERQTNSDGKVPLTFGALGGPKSVWE